MHMYVISISTISSGVVLLFIISTMTFAFLVVKIETQLPEFSCEKGITVKNIKEWKYRKLVYIILFNVPRIQIIKCVTAPAEFEGPFHPVLCC